VLSRQCQAPARSGPLGATASADDRIRVGPGSGPARSVEEPRTLALPGDTFGVKFSRYKIKTLKLSKFTRSKAHSNARASQAVLDPRIFVTSSTFYRIKKYPKRRWLRYRQFVLAAAATRQRLRLPVRHFLSFSHALVF
jgi:hypothetical protein